MIKLCEMQERRFLLDKLGDKPKLDSMESKWQRGTEMSPIDVRGQWSMKTDVEARNRHSYQASSKLLKPFHLNLVTRPPNPKWRLFH